MQPVFFRLEAEKAHNITMSLLAGMSRNRLLLWCMTRGLRPPTMERKQFGLSFPNPIGLAAGLDKNAIALPAWQALGFGFIEIGTVTARAQPGNDAPRLFRLTADRALINRMGFNNDGADAVAARLEAWKRCGRWPKVPVGINLGKSQTTTLEDAPADYAYSFRKLREHGDYFVVNVSSPNTPGLRSLQEAGALERLLLEIQEENEASRKPVFVKLSPDLEFDDVDDLVDAARRRSVSGFIATNTTLDHSMINARNDQEGGLSGRPLRAKSTALLRVVARRSQLPVIGAGGVDDAESAEEKFAAGASLVQLYTGLIYEGPGVVKKIMDGLISKKNNGV
jgi:dihydroorotate dehydrogenase